MAKAEFYQYMADAHEKRWSWGEHDCFLFAAGAVQAYTGVDHMATLRGYGDETGAAILLQERFGTLSLRLAFLAVAARACAQPVCSGHVLDGDVACVSWPHKFIHAHQIDQSTGLGVFYHGRAVVCSPAGLLRVPMGHRVIDVWRF